MPREIDGICGYRTWCYLHGVIGWSSEKRKARALLREHQKTCSRLVLVQSHIAPEPIVLPLGSLSSRDIILDASGLRDCVAERAAVGYRVCCPFHRHGFVGWFAEESEAERVRANHLKRCGWGVLITRGAL